jgi:hypothetical protein
MTKLESNVKMFLFARWISTCYADEHLDENMIYQGSKGFDIESSMSVLNREKGEWWKMRLQDFNEDAWPNYIKNGSVKKATEFLKDKL